MQTFADVDPVARAPAPLAAGREPWHPPYPHKPDTGTLARLAPARTLPAVGLLAFGRLCRQLAGQHALALLVAVPTLLAAWYYGLVASDIYISESRFVVRSAARQGTPGGLGAVLQGAGLTGFSKASDDAFAVNAFILSRDALSQLNNAMGLKTAYGALQIDRLSRFAGIDPDDSFDALFRFHLKQLDLRLDTVSSITTLTSQAFDSATAQAINDRLLLAAETFVNELNERARADLVRFATQDLTTAEKRSHEAAAALAAFRNAKSIADPERQTGLQLAQVSKLQDDLIATQGTLAQLHASAPDNSQVQSLQARVRATQAAIASQNAKITGGDSLASKTVEYQRMALDQEFANRQLAVALVALQDAKSDAQRKKLYLERIAQPNLPDSAERPRRLRNVLSVLVVCSMFAACLSVVLAGVREHRS